MEGGWHGMVRSVTLWAGHVEDDFLGLVVFGLGFQDNGAVGVEELVGDVGQDGGAARRDAAFGDKDQELGEELVDVNRALELGGFGEEVGRKVFRVVVDVHRKGNGSDCLGVAEAKARVRWKAGKAAALAVGIEIGAMGSSGFRWDYDGIGDGAGAKGCCAHEVFLFFWWERGTPHSMHEFENKRDAKWALRKCMKRKGRFFLR